MTKFIKTANESYVNVDTIMSIKTHANLITADTKDSVYTVAQCDSEEEAATLAMEFCLLVSSHPAGVFIFVKEDLLRQKASRDEQQKELPPIQQVSKRKEVRKK